MDANTKSETQKCACLKNAVRDLQGIPNTRRMEGSCRKGAAWLVSRDQDIM